MIFLAKYWKLIIGAVSVLAILGIGLYIKNVIAENQLLQDQLTQKTEELSKAIKSIENIEKDVHKQKELLDNTNTAISEIQQQAKQNVQIFQKHDLHDLSAKKPGLIEKRVNTATQRVFADLQKETEDFSAEVSK